MAALSTLQREAKENVYAVLDPHIQYELTINNHGEPPKYLSLSKPLTHQRTHAFDPQKIKVNDINNNESYNSRITSFKCEPKNRRSNRSNRSKRNKESVVCNSNNDIKYFKDPFFGMTKNIEGNAQGKPYVSRSSKNMYARNNSDRFKYQNNEMEPNLRSDVRRSSKRSRTAKDNEANKLTEINDYNDHEQDNGTEEDYFPRPGKVREIASRFDRNSVTTKEPVNRPRPVQSYDQAYLNHVFPDAVEI